MEGSDSTDTMEETPITPRKRKVKARAGPTASGSQSHRQQRYRQEWERNPAFKPWLTGTQDQHKAKFKRATTVTTIFEKSNKQLDERVASAEIKIAGVLAAHNVSFNVMDHLSEVLKDAFNDSKIAQEFTLKRTKATAVVRNVIEWALPKFTSFNTYFQSDKTVITELHEKVIILFKDLVLSFMKRDYINKTEFSLIDPGRSDKHLRDTEMYLGVKVLQALNDSSITARKPELQEFFQRCRNFLSVACCEIKKRYDFKDPVIAKLNTLAPSNVISGEFRKVVPSLVPLATELPLLVSPEDTALLQRLDDQWRMLPLQCDRWLVRGKIIYNILVNWEELKAYFNIAKIQGGQDVRYKARMLWEMLSDGTNYLYFVFASPIVTEFERLNALFQSTNCKPSHLCHELEIHCTSLTRRVYDENGFPVPLEKVDFGAKFISESELILANEKEQLQKLQDRCQEMMFTLVQQVKMRLPRSRELYDGLKKLSPSVVLTHTNRPPYTDLPFLHLQGQAAEACENQYRRILYHPWIEEGIFDGKIPDDPEVFWSKIKSYESEGSKPYSDLACYALSCLTTPGSAART
ncbi:hypothetical protein Pmani_027915 [Petrolisthes manimaculis]|uniref:Uncharacterized protein n=1 Tax=Petrolisthes manimaculis TaxID=1843537 RepID=A0AAE1P1R1_9EUCA|nr:hypothetical protein Pmani_027915 [Petrolisthes manimaculis]